VLTEEASYLLRCLSFETSMKKLLMFSQESVVKNLENLYFKEYIEPMFEIHMPSIKTLLEVYQETYFGENFFFQGCLYSLLNVLGETHNSLQHPICEARYLAHCLHCWITNEKSASRRIYSKATRRMTAIIQKINWAHRYAIYGSDFIDFEEGLFKWIVRTPKEDMLIGKIYNFLFGVLSYVLTL
jgi:hypothetical protein